MSIASFAALIISRDSSVSPGSLSMRRRNGSMYFDSGTSRMALHAQSLTAGSSSIRAFFNSPIVGPRATAREPTLLIFTSDPSAYRTLVSLVPVFAVPSNLSSSSFII